MKFSRAKAQVERNSSLPLANRYGASRLNVNGRDARQVAAKAFFTCGRNMYPTTQPNTAVGKT